MQAGAVKIPPAVRGDINPGIDSFRYYAGWARRIYGETIPVDGPFLNYTLREPVGVVGAMTALKLAELCAEAGVPEGVLNVITGYGATAGEAYALEQYTNVKSVWVAL